MSEQGKEPWHFVHDQEALASYVYFQADEQGPNCEFSWTRIDTTKEEQMERVERIVQDHNACLSMSDPEADVKALVESATKALEQFDKCTMFDADGSAFDGLRDALTRLRREP